MSKLKKTLKQVCE